MRVGVACFASVVAPQRRERPGELLGAVGRPQQLLHGEPAGHLECGPARAFAVGQGDERLHGLDAVVGGHPSMVTGTGCENVERATLPCARVDG